MVSWGRTSVLGSSHKQRNYKINSRNSLNYARILNENLPGP